MDVNVDVGVVVADVVSVLDAVLDGVADCVVVGVVDAPTHLCHIPSRHISPDCSVGENNIRAPEVKNNSCHICAIVILDFLHVKLSLLSFKVLLCPFPIRVRNSNKF